ncbi:MAG: glycosyltransferase family 2 protein, partial [Coriobacteriales bacterium]|nr:glycosyltransferase family 2 protein [Coriobacteriales bacterium]
MQNKKVITFVVPCYNSADYMDNCIKSLVDLNSIDDDIEIIIVDDGSQEDNTLKKAQAWKKKFPAIVKVIHQENGGHGAAVNIGLKSAKGLYFNVVDSDDYLDKQGTAPVMEYIRKQARTATDISPATDMIIANYVYNKATKNKLVPMKYTKFLPQNREFTWDDIKKFKMTYYLSMHSIIYRTQILQDINFELPKHTFYVDSIYSCEPLLYVKS